MSGKVLEIVLKMSLIGCYSTMIVLLVRFLILKLLRAPRKYACYLWMAVFLNLCLPFSVRGPVSLIPQDVGMLFEGSARMEEEEVSPETAPADGEMTVQLPVDAGALPQAGSTPSGEWPGAGQIQGADGESQQETDENAGQETGTEARVSARERAAFLIWLGGAACVLGYQGLTALRFRRRLSRLRCVKESKRRRLYWCWLRQPGWCCGPGRVRTAWRARVSRRRQETAARRADMPGRKTPGICRCLITGAV